MIRAPQKYLCPQCQKMTLSVWPPTATSKERRVCTNDHCQYRG